MDDKNFTEQERVRRHDDMKRRSLTVDRIRVLWDLYPKHKFSEVMDILDHFHHEEIDDFIGQFENEEDGFSAIQDVDTDGDEWLNRVLKRAMREAPVGGA